MQMLCDFYNLHLKSGRQYWKPHQLTDETIAAAWQAGKVKMPIPGHARFIQDETFPDEKERQRILDFFTKHCPEVLTHPDAQSVEAKRTQGSTLEGDEIGSLGEYEYTNKVSWFESQDYLDFTDHWHNLRLLLDSIIARQLDLSLFIWFRLSALHWKEPRLSGQTDEKGYTLNCGLINSEGNPVNPNLLYFQDNIKTVPLGEWKVEETHTITAWRYGISISSLLYEIHWQVIYAMKNPTLFGRCKAKATPRRPACQNLFFVKKRRGPTQIWCSNTCRRRIYEAKKVGNL